MAKMLSMHDSIVSTARQKYVAARARSLCSTAEKPKEVISAACGVMASAVEEDGFSSTKRGRALKREKAGLTSTIIFQSDVNNIAGERAAVWISAMITSKELGKANRSQPFPSGSGDKPGADIVTGFTIGNLLAEPTRTWMEWDFASEETRQSEIEDAIGAIRRIIYPFFALFDDPPSAVQLLIQRPAVIPLPLIRYANFALGREAAERAGATYLGRNPGVRERFDEMLARFKSDGLPTCYRCEDGELAAFAITYGLDFHRQS